MGVGQFGLAAPLVRNERSAFAGAVVNARCVRSEDGSVFSTGTGTAEYQGQKIKQPLTFEVVEREGGWFIIRNVNPNDDESWFDTAAR